jgi:aspartyl-tRNA(Asn)/glutamyl-tRNA(Gln) amidotransferase subunit B
VSWETVIGLEVHVQLATRTKLFCGCAPKFGAAPNSRTCPVCTGQPGALPVLNAAAVELAVRTALAVGAEVHLESQFARKNYHYVDLPKAYQITQYEQPYCTGGTVPLADGRGAPLERIHMEEDAGKAIHDRGPYTLVDLNRAGVPLVEVVGLPTLRSAAEAVELLRSLRELVRWIGASRADMDKGELRCDVNVSVRRPGAPLGTKVEVKNLNSFRHVQGAVEHEARRQVGLLERGEQVLQQTRLFDPATGETRAMRSKEDADDYRYFPDPDLPPLRLTEALVERQRGFLPELPAARRARYQEELALSAYDAGVLTGERATSEWFEGAVRAGAPPKAAANWVANELLGALADEDVPAADLDELPCTPRAPWSMSWAWVRSRTRARSRPGARPPSRPSPTPPRRCAAATTRPSGR